MKISLMYMDLSTIKYRVWAFFIHFLAQYVCALARFLPTFPLFLFRGHLEYPGVSLEDIFRQVNITLLTLFTEHTHRCYGES